MKPPSSRQKGEEVPPITRHKLHIQAHLAAAGPETAIWLVGQRAPVSCWGVTTGTPSSSVSPDPSDTQQA
jgi:hypothetical protein